MGFAGGFSDAQGVVIRVTDHGICYEDGIKVGGFIERRSLSFADTQNLGLHRAAWR